MIRRSAGYLDDNLDGLTKFYKDGRRTAELTNAIKGKDFEFAMLHEIGHYIYGYDEEAASDYANRMIKIVNETK